MVQGYDRRGAERDRDGLLAELDVVGPVNDFPEQDFPPAQPAQDEDFVRFFAQHKDECLRTAISWTRCLEDADEILMNAAVNMCRKWPRITRPTTTR
ncbi:hypothetical protein [Streptomyces sp. NPDC017988]|uniref:hypothetical protein n=1 Tax=Streptomyces sp. NPDC017988 TaxID=3365025 RepID=UPI0037BB6B54